MLFSLMLALLAWLGMTGPALAQDIAPGVLQINATARGAQVHVDYEPVGEVPVTRYLPPGSYLIRVSADGYEPFVRKVDVRSNTTTSVNAELVAGGGTVEFVVRPAGAQVELNGQAVGKAPIRVASMPAGDYRYKVSLPGYEAVEGRFTQNPGGNPLFVVALESSRGRFEVQTRPEGAQVWLDGALVGETPLRLQEVPPGVHTVLVGYPGSAWVLREVDTSDGSKGEIDASLAETGTLLTLNTQRADAELLLAGVPVATGRQVEVLLTRGDWPLAVRSGGETLETTLTVPLTGHLLYKVRWAEDGEAARLIELAPLVQRWTFWAAVGAGAGAAAGTSALLARALAPEPPPSGDIVVTLP